MKSEKILLKIAQIDHIAIGSVMCTYKKCGKTNCRCYSDDHYKHGPYYVWTRKENGKTITKTLNKKQTQACLKALKNMGKLNRYIENWKKESIKEILNL